MKILIVATEASGDALGAAVFKHLRHRIPSLRAFGVGGPALRALGIEALARAEDLSVMGLTDVFQKVPQLLSLRNTLLATAQRQRPPLALLCDSPDFNLPLGLRLRRHGTKVAMLAAPQAWAWRPRRALKMHRSLDLLLTLFDFETPFFRDAGVPTEFIGHPLAASWRHEDNTAGVTDAVALLPGSRPAELARHLPIMLEAETKLRELAGVEKTLVSVAPTLERQQFAPFLPVNATWLSLVDGTREALSRARLAIVVSGTAALEAALACTPAVVVYRTDALTWQVGRRLVRTPHIAMPNILHGDTLFPEVLQAQVSPDNILTQAERVLSSTHTIMSSLHGLRRRLLPPFQEQTPEERAAALIIERFRLTRHTGPSTGEGRRD